uniref:CBS domain-containing protein n=1 Tax=Syphacia muris TaxID=451379 RepID=A0A0N5B0Q1_9BILA
MQQQQHKLQPYNVYIRHECDDIDTPESSSPSKRFFDSFREKISLRSHHNSVSGPSEDSNCDEVFTNVELPPPYYDPPKECFDYYGHSVPMDSGYLTSGSRSRSSSDVAPQNSSRLGTLIIFPVAPPPSPEWNFDEKMSYSSELSNCSHTLRNVSERYCSGSCIMKGGSRLPLLKIPTHNFSFSHKHCTHHVARSSSPLNIFDDRRFYRNTELSSSPNERFSLFPLSPSSVPRQTCSGRCRAASSSIVLDGHSSPIGNFAIVFKESAGSPSVPSSPVPVKAEFENVVLESPNYAYSLFMKTQDPYNLAPHSGMVATFDLEMNVRQAYSAMVQNNFRTVAVTDTLNGVYVHLFTTHDFVEMAVRYYDSSRGITCIKELEGLKLSDWCKTKASEGCLLDYFLVLEKVFDMLQLMDQRSLDWLPSVEPTHNSLVYCISFKRALRYLCSHTHFLLQLPQLPYPKFMQETPKDLGLGVWKNFFKADCKQTLIEVCRLMTSHKISSIPIVDENNKLLGVFAESDILHLNLYEKLEAPMSEVLIDLRKVPPRLYTCNINDNLLRVTQIMSAAYVYRLMVVEGDFSLVGIISVRDLIRFMILEPPLDPNGAIRGLEIEGGIRKIDNSQ